ncbi:uncharacterized protein LOC144104417 [Amblyomma americanum]
MAHIEHSTLLCSFYRGCSTAIVSLAFAALLPSCCAQPSVIRYALKPCSPSPAIVIRNVEVKTQMDRGQAILAFTVNVRRPLEVPTLRITVNDEALNRPEPEYKLCDLVQRDREDNARDSCNLDPQVYHAEVKVSGYQAFFLTSEGARSRVRFEVIDKGQVVGCYSNAP